MVGPTSVYAAATATASEALATVRHTHHPCMKSALRVDLPLLYVIQCECSAKHATADFDSVAAKKRKTHTSLVRGGREPYTVKSHEVA